MNTGELPFALRQSPPLGPSEFERAIQQIILEALGIGITVQDTTGQIVYANDRAAGIIGCPSAAELCAMTVDSAAAQFDVFHADGRPFTRDDMPGQRALAGEATEEVMVRFRRRGDTTERWSLIRATPVRDVAGHITHAVNLIREVTDQSRDNEHRRFLLRATDELNASLEYEETLSTVARLAVPVLGDWCAVDVVDGGRSKRVAVAHVDPDKLRLVEEIERKYPPDPNASTGVPNVLRTGRAEFVPNIPRDIVTAAAVDDEHLRLIDKLHLCSYICAPLNVHGRTIGALTFAMAESGRRYSESDVAFTQALADRAALAIANARLYREAHHAREASEERFRLMVGQVKDYAIFMLTPTGNIATWNDGARSIKGYEASEIIGQHFSRFYPEEAVRAGKCEWMLRIATEKGRVEDEGWRVKKDGSRFWADVIITSVRDMDGKLVGFTKVARDLSERRKLEEERLARARAESELAEQKKLDELREQLLGVVGHDLRSPLGAISMATHLMIKRGILPDSEMKTAALIARNADRMAKMVAQLLDFTRARLGGGIPLDPKPMDLAELCEELVAEAEAAHPQRTIQFDSDVSTAGIWDRDRIGQVIANLLGNAIQHGDETAPVALHVHDDGPASVRVTVHNAGPPIPTDALPTLFDPFRRASVRRGSKDKSDSLGLGLYIVREIIHAHAGNIDVTSNESGTTFCVILARDPTYTKGSSFSSHSAHRP